MISTFDLRYATPLPDAESSKLGLAKDFKTLTASARKAGLVFIKFEVAVKCTVVAEFARRSILTFLASATCATWSRRSYKCVFFSFRILPSPEFVSSEAWGRNLVSAGGDTNFGFDLDAKTPQKAKRTYEARTEDKASAATKVALAQCLKALPRRVGIAHSGFDSFKWKGL